MHELVFNGWDLIRGSLLAFLGALLVFYGIFRFETRDGSGGGFLSAFLGFIILSLIAYGLSRLNSNYSQAESFYKELVSSCAKSPYYTKRICEHRGGCHDEMIIDFEACQKLNEYVAWRKNKDVKHIKDEL